MAGMDESKPVPTDPSLPARTGHRTPEQRAVAKASRWQDNPYLPKSLRQKLSTASADVNLGDKLLLLDVLLQDELASLDQSSPEERHQAALKIVQNMRIALNASEFNKKTVKTLLEKLEEVLTRSDQSKKTKVIIREITQEFTNIARVEQQRQADKSKSIPLAEVRGLLNDLLVIIDENVVDPDIRRAIAHGFDRSLRARAAKRNFERATEEIAATSETFEDSDEGTGFDDSEGEFESVQIFENPLSGISEESTEPEAL